MISNDIMISTYFSTRQICIYNTTTIDKTMTENSNSHILFTEIVFCLLLTEQLLHHAFLPCGLSSE